MSVSAAPPSLEGKDSNIIGVNVVNRQHARIGKVEDVAIHKRVAYLVLSFGDDMSGKRYALPWSVVHFENALQAFVLDMSQEEVGRLPAFEDGTWPAFTQDQSNCDAARLGDIPPF